MRALECTWSSGVGSRFLLTRRAMGPLAISILLAVALGLFAYTMYFRVKSMLALKPDGTRFSRVPERIEALILKDPIPYMDLFKLNSFGEGEYVADFGRYWWSREKTPAYAICCAAREAMQSIRDRNTTR